MFEHILIPTDGSELSEHAIKHAIRFAKFHNARVSGLCVVIDRLFATGMGEPMGMTGNPEDSARKFLSVIADEAAAAGVPCECFLVHGGSPHEEILATAAQRDCDLIYMASHGRTGFAGFLLGQEAAHVIAGSKVPVLVHR